MIARYGSLVIFLLLVVLAAAAGASFEAGEWYYTDLTQPSWAPSPWLLAPAWAVAWLFAALAAWNAWLTGHYDRVRILTWWSALPMLHVLWSFLHFGVHRIGWAWLAASLSVVVTILCYRQFKRISEPAAWLLIPFLVWVAFNWLLNLANWTLNGGILARLIF